jgi:hypothetical protein
VSVLTTGGGSDGHRTGATNAASWAVLMNARKLAAVLALSAGAYALALRPRMLRWGATDDELRRPYPGADVVPGGTRGATMATTIDAPPSRVWPWLVQMGCNRAGWYSWDRLDNAGVASAKRIHPEWQEVSIGDHMTSLQDGSAWFEVAALEPQRFLGLRATLTLRGRPLETLGSRPGSYTDSLWGFLLEELPGGRTRLVVSGYGFARPRLVGAAGTSSSGSPRTGSCRRASSRTSSAAPSAGQRSCNSTTM